MGTKELKDVDLEIAQKIAIVGSIISTTVAFILVIYYIIVADYERALYNSIFLIVAILPYIAVKKFGNIKLAANTLVVMIFMSSILTIIMNSTKSFRMMWLILFPIASVMLKGRKLGLRLSILFVIMAISLIGYLHPEVTAREYFNIILVESLVIVVIDFYEKTKTDLINRAKEALEKAEDAAMHDSMTGLYNRRFFNQIFNKEINRSYRESRPLGFFILDIDYFKQFNDNFGHSVGDNAIVAVTNAMKSRLLRTEDYLFRLGGEEFGGIIVGNDFAGIRETVESLLTAVEILKIERKYRKASKYLTVSIGLILIPKDSQLTEEEIYITADKALYNAKDSGRNRITVV